MGEPYLKKNQFWRANPWLLAVIILSLIYPWLSPEYYVDLAFNVLIYVILAESLNIIIGFAGLLNLGHAAFFGVGAYTYGILWRFFSSPSSLPCRFPPSLLPSWDCSWAFRSSG